MAETTSVQDSGNERTGLVRHLVPPPGPIRVLFAANLGRSLANGILLSVVVLYFTSSVGISAARLAVWG